MDERRYLYGFEKLEVWKVARGFVRMIYALSREFPQHEMYGLASQIRRAAISISANITEGSSRLSKKDFAHFLQIAYSSLMEVLNHVYLAYDLQYIDDEKLQLTKDKVFLLSNKINALHKVQVR